MTAQTTFESTPASAWRTRDIVVTATIGVVFGFVFWAWNVVWNTLVAPASVVAPLWGFLIYGVWLVPAVLAPLIVRKPGAAVFAEIVAAAVSAFLPGNVWGPDVLLSGLVQGAAAREERRSVAVGTHAEQDEVEAREFSGLEREEAAQFVFIFEGGCGGVGILRFHPEDIFGGNGNLRQQRLMHHAVVAVGVIGWDVALVAEK